MQIQSIRIIQDRINLEKHVRVITALDGMLSDSVKEIAADSGYGAILTELLWKKKLLFHPYLYKTFDSLATHKKEIEISLKYIQFGPTVVQNSGGNKKGKF